MSHVKIFVGNIAVGTAGAELRELFSQYGQVTECDVLGAGNYAFVVSILTVYLLHITCCRRTNFLFLSCSDPCKF